MSDKANKPTRRALERWETEGGATLEGPQVPKRKKRPRDTNQLAKRVVDIATGEEEDRDPAEGKDPAAVSLGRRGGLKGGKARAAKLSPARKRQIAKTAAAARWKTR